MSWELRKPIEDQGWTIPTLLEYTNARIADMELRQQQRWEAQSKAVDTAIIAQRAAIDAALAAADKAVLKSEAATELRFQSVNEFRGQLTDQAATFMTRNELNGIAQRQSDAMASLSSQVTEMISRDEALAAIGRNSERLQDVNKRMDSFINRDSVLAQYNAVLLKVEAIAERQTKFESKGSGMHSAWLYLVGFIAVLGTLVTLYLSLR